MNDSEGSIYLKSSLILMTASRIFDQWIRIQGKMIQRDLHHFYKWQTMLLNITCHKNISNHLNKKNDINDSSQLILPKLSSKCMSEHDNATSLEMLMTTAPHLKPCVIKSKQWKHRYF